MGKLNGWRKTTFRERKADSNLELNRWHVWEWKYNTQQMPSTTTIRFAFIWTINIEKKRHPIVLVNIRVDHDWVFLERISFFNQSDVSKASRLILSLINFLLFLSKSLKKKSLPKIQSKYYRGTLYLHIRVSTMSIEQCKQSRTKRLNIQNST